MKPLLKTKIKVQYYILNQNLKISASKYNQWKEA